ncbi:glycosyltransferase family 4 protein [candidate division KSB1 bacterium]|nr:glycosyltransferase family 4 protein [bacterium]NUM65683.1 glycosyltransferase family 4 protein [candidate division KSB1 bacterium]
MIAESRQNSIAAGTDSHICFLQDSLYSPALKGWTGTHLQNFLLAKHFKAAGMRVCFVVASASPEIKPSNPYEGMPVHFLKVPEIAPFAAAWRKTMRLLQSVSPDFVYVKGRSWLAGVARAYAGATGAKFMWASNNEDGCGPWKYSRKTLTSSKSLFRKAAKLFASATEDLIYARAIAGADFCINQTHRQQLQLAKAFQKKGIVIPSVQDVPVGPFQKDTEPFLLWVGYFAREKGPECFLKLAHAFRDASFRFCMVGAPSPNLPLTEALLLAQQNGKFEYLGQLPHAEVLKLMERAWLLVSTSGSNGDGIPNVMVEAWLREVPTLSLQLDPEGIIQKHGLGVVAQNFEELRVALPRLLTRSDQLHEMGKQARRKAEELFSAKTNVARYLEIMFPEKLTSVNSLDLSVR